MSYFPPYKEKEHLNSLLYLTDVNDENLSGRSSTVHEQDESSFREPITFGEAISRGDYNSTVKAHERLEAMTKSSKPRDKGIVYNH